MTGRIVASSESALFDTASNVARRSSSAARVPATPSTVSTRSNRLRTRLSSTASVTWGVQVIDSGEFRKSAAPTRNPDQPANTLNVGRESSAA
jgi:hypothetical protein